jgi:hypothetical protein
MSSSLADLSTLSRLLDEALDLEPAQAEAWLVALPEAHRHLLPQLREMLSAHLSPGHAGFMSDGPKLAGGAVDETVARPDDRVGPYRLIREIGRGGMGAVWLAERADGSLKRHVALKLPRLAWGAGLAERMARERDIGALLLLQGAAAHAGEKARAQIAVPAQKPSRFVLIPPRKLCPCGVDNLVETRCTRRRIASNSARSAGLPQKEAAGASSSLPDARLRDHAAGKAAEPRRNLTHDL